MKDKNGNVNCNGCQECHNSVNLIYCCDQILEKFRIFNKKVLLKDYEVIKNKIQSQLGYYKHPIQLTTEDINWLKKEIKQFDQKVLNKIISDSILPDKPKE